MIRKMKVLCGFLLLSLLFISKAEGQANHTPQAGTANEEPGHIPGMGNEKGLPAGSRFMLPKGVSLVGELRGATYAQATPGGCGYDGVGTKVIVKFKMQRDSVGGPLTITFPPGLTVTAAAEGFQNGLLVERVVVTVPPKGPGPGKPQCDVTLMMACLNLFKKPSDESATYQFGPVSSSPLIKDLMKRLSGKKMLYSAYTDKEEWEQAQESVQDALWGLTDHDGLSDDMLRFISELPDK